MRRRKLFPLAAICGAVCCLIGSTATLGADEWETNTPYYEDDAWYDVSEWLDGNDYNPTDESPGVWDNETYDLSSETGVDRDNDSGNTLYDDEYGYDDDYGYNGGYDYDDPYTYDTEDYYNDEYYGEEYIYDYDYDSPYGYETQNYLNDAYDISGYDYDYDYDDPYTYDSGDYYDDVYGYDGLYEDDDWFYDYYDDGYTYYSDFDNDGLYDYNYRYFDFDNDNYYDAYSVYTDWDGDGLFEDYDYYSLNDIGSSDENQQNAKDQSSKQGKEQRIRGKVVQVKKVSVKDTKNLLIRMEEDDGEKLYVDLGPANNLVDLDISQGDQIAVRGPVSKVGEKQLLVAQQLQANNKSVDINRNRRQFTGKVDGLASIKSRGQEHRILRLSSESGKRRLVDLGPIDKFDVDLSQGDKVTVRGPMTKINDREVVLAQSLSLDGDQVEIDRRQRQSTDSNRQASNN